MTALPENLMTLPVGTVFLLRSGSKVTFTDADGGPYPVVTEDEMGLCRSYTIGGVYDSGNVGSGLDIDSIFNLPVQYMDAHRFQFLVQNPTLIDNLHGIPGDSFRDSVDSLMKRVSLKKEIVALQKEIAEKETRKSELFDQLEAL